MTWQLALGIFFLAWSLAFVIALPVGLKTPDSMPNTPTGTDPGAPDNPHLGKKIVISAGVALLVVGMFWLMVRAGYSPRAFFRPG